MDRGSFFEGAAYFFKGLKLLSHPRLRGFVVVPIIVNFAIFIGLTVLLTQEFNNVVTALTDWLPSWLAFLAWILSIIAALFAVLLYGYFFSLITNFFAAPFYGILSEKVEQLHTGNIPQGESLWQLIPRTFLRELSKLWYFVWRSVIVLLLGFLPVFGQFIGFVWGAWSMAVQYTDYPADNHQWPFSRCRQRLGSTLWSSLGFGAVVMVGLMIPLFNILVPTAAVIGGTLYWLETERD